MKVISFVLWALAACQAVAGLDKEETSNHLRHSEDERLLTSCTPNCCDKPDGTKCNTGSGNKCLKQSKCYGGKCKPGPVKVCNPPTQCKVAVGGCNPTTGFCKFKNKPNYTPCDDGNDETVYDTCIDGLCVQEPCRGPCCGLDDGTPCSTDDLCYKNSYCYEEVCELGEVKECTPPTQCKVVIGECDPTTGFCTFENKPNYTPCDDGNDATTDDVCIDGFCVQKPCTGPCCGLDDGTPCSITDDLCYKQSACKDDVCELGPVKECDAPTQCKDVIGACDPSTGFCTNQDKPDYTPCDDGDASTPYDVCIGGFCVPDTRG